MRESARKLFVDQFGEQPTFIVRAPGRVNLLGGHTDYNDGFVLPMALERAVWLAAAPNEGRCVELYSAHFKETKEASLEAIEHSGRSWFEYIKGMAWVLQGAGFELAGWKGVAVSDIPIGAGLSSSAAFELAAARVFAAVSNYEWEPAFAARLAQRAENEWVGVNCGIMDQLICAAGEEGRALFIDCRSLETTAVNLPADSAVVIMDSKTRRTLSDSAYNQRRDECAEAAALMGVAKLRDVNLENLMESRNRLNPVVLKRARHVITENKRVLMAIEALNRGDAAAFGRLISASHTSLRDDYEVSSPELNIMVEAAQQQAGCYGARMTGAGFGGCAVALVESNQAAEFAATVRQIYREMTGIDPTLYISKPAQGTELRTVQRQGE